MWSTILILVAAVPLTSAISLLDSISNTPELSILNSYIQKFPKLQTTLQNANNYTLLAPSDTVLTAYVSQNPDLNDLEATLNYHLVNGTFADTDFQTNPLFPATYLTNSSYTNVTGGAHVRIAVDSGRAEIESYNKTKSFITTADMISAGGLMHIINSVLIYPKSLLDQAPQFKFFVSILTKGNFVNTASDSFSTQILGMTDITGFCPDTQQALDTFTSLVAKSTQADLNGIFNYHLVQGKVTYSPEMTDGLQIKTIQGRNLTIHVGPDGTKYVNGLRIIDTDYSISNGVLHRIDGTLDPNNVTTPVFATSTPSSASTPSASSTLTPHHGLSGGAKAGIALSVLILVGLLAAGALFFLRRRRQNESQNLQPYLNAAELDRSGARDGSSNSGNWDWEQQSKHSASELHGDAAAYAMRPLPPQPLPKYSNEEGKDIVHVAEYQAEQRPSYAVELEAARVRSPPIDRVRVAVNNLGQSPVTRSPVSPPE